MQNVEESQGNFRVWPTGDEFYQQETTEHSSNSVLNLELCTKKYEDRFEKKSIENRLPQKLVFSVPHTNFIRTRKKR